MTDALEQNAKGVSIILDPLKFRRAGLASALTQWAIANAVEIEQRELEQPELAQIENLRLAIINLGGASVSDSETLGAISKLHLLAPNARIVVISDREDGAEVVAAFKSGVHGFIPTSTEPSVALQALSFVLAGGSFFPPNVLLGKGRNTPQISEASLETKLSMGPAKHFTPSQLRTALWRAFCGLTARGSPPTTRQAMRKRLCFRTGALTQAYPDFYGARANGPAPRTSLDIMASAICVLF
jgi:DNA-binding NarL/FixJ family response regulator